MFIKILVMVCVCGMRLKKWQIHFGKYISSECFTTLLVPRAMPSMCLKRVLYWQQEREFKFEQNRYYRRSCIWK